MSPDSTQAPALRSLRRRSWRRSSSRSTASSGMLYISSNSTTTGDLRSPSPSTSVPNLDTAQVQVQNRVAIAKPRLPADVRNIGVTVAKASPDLMMVVHMFSPDKSRDTLFISNYANVNVVDVLSRIQGVGSITVFGGRDYSMRVWLDPERLQSLDLTSSDVRPRCSARTCRSRPASSTSRRSRSRTLFRSPCKRWDASRTRPVWEIVVKQSADAVVRLKDVARVELAALDYGVNSFLDRDPAVGSRHFPVARLECHRHRAQDQGDDEGAGEELPAGRRARHRLQPDRLHPAVRRRGHHDDPRGGRARRARRDPVPADLACGDHSDRRHSRVAHRHLLP